MPKYRLRDDVHGEPVAHAASCFCPSMSNGGINHQADWWEAEADDIGALAESLEEDSIADGSITRAEARKMLRLAHCIEAPVDDNGVALVGRRYSGKPTDNLGKWERSLAEPNKKTKKILPPPPKQVIKMPAKMKEVRMAFSEADRVPGRPITAHSMCSHPVSKTARAKCRRDRAKNG